MEINPQEESTSTYGNFNDTYTSFGDPDIAKYMTKGLSRSPYGEDGWSEAEPPLEEEERVFCTVTKPERVTSGTNSFVTYLVSSKVEGVTVINTRRYNDFFNLHQQLKEEFRHLIIPPIPGKEMITTIKQNSLVYVEGDPKLTKMIPAGFSRNDPAADEFTENRRKGLEKFLQRVYTHPILKDSNILKIFLTSKDFEKDRQVKVAQDAQALTTPKKGLFASFSEMITGPTPVVPKEVDPWFENQKNYMINLERSVQLLADRTNQYTTKTRESMKYLTDFGDTAYNLSKVEAEQEKTMHQHWEKLHQVLSQAAAIQDEVALGVDATLKDTLRDQVKTIQAARDLLNYRTEVLGRHQTYCADEKIKEDKMVKANNSSAIAELEDVRNKKLKEEQTFEMVTKSAKSELEAYQQTRKITTHKMLKEYVKMNIDTMTRETGLWKELLADLQDTDTPSLQN